MACNTEDLTPSEIILGCTDPSASNFNPNATLDDGSCNFISSQISGCTDSDALNYNLDAVIEDCSCIYELCPPNTVIQSGILYYPGPCEPDIVVTPPGNPLPPADTNTTSGRSIIGGDQPTRSNTRGTSATSTPSFPPPPQVECLLPIEEDCCPLEDGFYWDGEFCRQIGDDPCPENGVSITDAGVFVDSTTGLAINESCCDKQEDSTWASNYDLGPNSSPRYGACLKNGFLTEDCELNINDVIYVGNTVVYNTTVPTQEPDGTGPVTGPALPEPIEEETQSCMGVSSWSRGIVECTDCEGNSEVNLLSVTKPINNEPYPSGTYLWVFNTADVNVLDLEPGDQIEVSGVEVDSLNFCYYSNLGGLVNDISTVTKVYEPISNSGVYRVVTNIELTNTIQPVINLEFSCEDNTITQSTLVEGIEVCPIITQLGGRSSGGNLINADLGCTECNTVLDTITSFDFGQPVTDIKTTTSPLTVTPTYWVSQTGVNDICGIIYPDDRALLRIQITNPNIYSYGEEICQQVRLTDAFWDALASSSYAQYINEPNLLIERPLLNVLTKGGDSEALYLPISIMSNVFIDNNVSSIPNINGSFCLCDVSGQRAAAAVIKQPATSGGFPNLGPVSPVGPALSPCDEEAEQPPIPESPTPTNDYENLSEACCLSLGEEFGWTYVGGVCYWKAPLGNTTTQFGISETDIIVSDPDCNQLTISAAFYLERPDNPICEVDNTQDITATLAVYSGDDLDNTQITTTTVSSFSLSSDGYCQWTNISSQINNDGSPFKVKLILNGVKECCEYDIFVDDIKTLCSKQDTISFTNYNACPGFKLTKVIDNKKSWVYNDNTPLNRVFAPSPDADIPWRYTNYFEQSGVYENSSKLVLNSKELYLTFNMKKQKRLCPEGYTYNELNGNCFKEALSCPIGFNLSGSTCFSGVTTTTATTVNVITDRTNDCNTELNIFELIDYKNNFQNFWVKFIEQFIPATTIFVAGEKWSNREDEICNVIEPCGYLNSFSEGDLGLKNSSATIAREPINKNINKSVQVVTSKDNVTTTRNGDYGDNKTDAPIILGNFKGYYLKKDTSILSERRLTLLRGELPLLKTGQQEYQSKFKKVVYKLEQ